MTRRPAPYLAWGLWVVLAALGGLGTALFFGASRFDVDTAALMLAFALFPTVGALIVSNRPGNVTGWIFLFIGIGTAITYFSAGYLAYETFAQRHLPGAAIVDWMGNLVWPLNIGFGLLLLQVFPTGRPLSPRWRSLAWITVVLLAADALASGFMPGQFSGETTINPFGIDALGPLLNLVPVGAQILIIPVGLLSVLSAILRFWRSRGDQRQQMKWFAYGAAVGVICIAVNVVVIPNSSSSPGSSVGFAAAFAALPIGAGVAVLRYRLYDIDVLINRTLVYATLTATLAGVYFGTVFAAEAILRLATGRRDLPAVVIVATTLVIAALFTPLRRRIQAIIDQRFYRRKYDAARTLTSFGQTLRTETDLTQLSAHLLDVVEETMRPAYASLWLLPPRRVVDATTSATRAATARRVMTVREP